MKHYSFWGLNLLGRHLEDVGVRKAKGLGCDGRMGCGIVIFIRYHILLIII